MNGQKGLSIRFRDNITEKWRPIIARCRSNIGNRSLSQNTSRRTESQRPMTLGTPLVRLCPEGCPMAANAENES
jgi:hypothetical protein